MANQPSSRNFYRWFDPRGRDIGSYAFILNRVTALGLTLYLVLHLFMLGKLAQGPEAYNDFVKLAKTPVIKIGEMLVIAAGLIHGLNGIRIALTSFGVLVRDQKKFFIILMVIALIGSAVFAWKMFFGE